MRDAPAMSNLRQRCTFWRVLREGARRNIADRRNVVAWRAEPAAERSRLHEVSTASPSIFMFAENDDEALERPSVIDITIKPECGFGKLLFYRAKEGGGIATAAGAGDRHG